MRTFKSHQMLCMIIIGLLVCQFNSEIITRIEQLNTNHGADTWSVGNFPLNNNYDSSKVIINSVSKQCAQKVFPLPQGFYTLSFSYMAEFLTTDVMVGIKILWNGKQLSTINAKNSLVQKYSYRVNSVQQDNVLLVCPVGGSTDVKNSHKIFLLNLNLPKDICQQKQFQDLIVNGGFEKNTCANAWCIFNTVSFKPDTVPGWMPSPQIQIGKGNIYNQEMGTSWVSELEGNKATCIKQNIANLAPGKYTFQFKWAARGGIALASNSLQVKFGNSFSQTFTPTDYKVKNQKIGLQISSPGSITELSVCGTGKSDGNGAVVDDFKLFYLDECTRTLV